MADVPLWVPAGIRPMPKLPIAGKLAVCMSLALNVSRAQVSTGTIVGIVEDNSDGLVPNASVALTQTATGQARQTHANDHGQFTRNYCGTQYSGQPTSRPRCRLKAEAFWTALSENRKNSMTVHLVNLTNPMMMKGPVREVIPISSQQVRSSRSCRLTAHQDPFAGRRGRNVLPYRGRRGPHRTAFDRRTRGDRA
jgi:hypothetical protein